MAKGKANSSRRETKLGIAVAVVALFTAVCLVLTASSYGLLPKGIPSWETIFGKQANVSANSKGNVADFDGSEVHFVDCGQGDCEVIISDGSVTVIDSGPRDHADKTYKYIKDLGIKKIDNLVLTHAHEDHIGGAVRLIKGFEIGKIYMSRPKKDKAPTTAVYINMLKAISEKGLKITAAKAGDSFKCGDFTMDIISPSKSYDELNNQSVIIHAVNKNISFMFTGDAESEPLADVMKKYPDKLKSTVLKVGHHGSKTSTNDRWLKAVAPQYGVILCETGNSYGHPHGVVLKRLAKAGVKVYRTDLQGSIVMKTDGNNIDISTEKENR